MRKTIVLTGIFLAACAAVPPTPEQLAAQAKADSTPNLCAATLVLSGEAVKAAQTELAARRATCDWQQAYAIAQIYLQKQEELRQRQAANNAALAGIAAALMQMGQPRSLAPAPVTTNCAQNGFYYTCTTY